MGRENMKKIGREDKEWDRKKKWGWQIHKCLRGKKTMGQTNMKIMGLVNIKNLKK